MKRIIIFGRILTILLFLCGCYFQQQGYNLKPTASAPISESEPTKIVEPTPADAMSKEEAAVMPAETGMISPEPELDTSGSTVTDTEAYIIEFPDDED